MGTSNPKGMLGTTLSVASTFVMASNPYVAFAMLVVGGYLQGQAQKEDLKDDLGVLDAGIQLQTRRDNTSPVAIAYGSTQLVGNYIFEKTNSAVTTVGVNRDYWAIIVLCEADIGLVNKIIANKENLPNNYPDIFSDDYTQVKYYLSSGANGIALKDVGFVTDNAGTVQNWSAIGNSLEGSNLTLTNFNNNDGAVLVDGNISTYRELQFGSCSVTIDFENTVKLKTLKINVSTRGYYDGAYDRIIDNIHLQYYDGANWITQSSNYSNTYLGLPDTQWINIALNEIVDAQYYRILLTNNSSSIKPNFYDLEVETETTTNLTIPPNVAYITVHQKYDPTYNTSLADIKTVVSGKEVRILNTFSNVLETYTQYSPNPIDILIDILLNGLKVSENELDLPTFSNCKTKCGNIDYRCDINFYSLINVQSAIKEVLATFRGYLVYSQGKYKLKMDEPNKPTSKVLTNADIVDGSFSFTTLSSKEMANIVEVNYIDFEDSWLSNKVVYKDEELITLDNEENIISLNIKGIIFKEHALKMAEINLNMLRYSEDSEGNRIAVAPLNISFDTSLKNSDLEVGDIIELNFDLLPNVKKFTILQVDTSLEGVISISAREYCETHFKNAINEYII